MPLTVGRLRITLEIVILSLIQGNFSVSVSVLHKIVRAPLRGSLRLLFSPLAHARVAVCEDRRRLRRIAHTAVLQVGHYSTQRATLARVRSNERKI